MHRYAQNGYRIFGWYDQIIIDNELYHKDYVVNYTNAAYLVKDEYGFEDGLFSGYDQENRKYDVSSWDYKYGEDGLPLTDPTLQDPRCVFQLMKKHYERYDIDSVCKITGTPKNKYLEVLDMFCATGAPNKTGTIMYAMGITQHTSESKCKIFRSRYSCCSAIWADPARCQRTARGKQCARCN
jgi:formate dehydrogenase major subunit